MTDEKVLENRLRRIAQRRGMQLLKSRRRDPQAIDYGGFMLTDTRFNAVILGGEGWAYSAALEDIRKYLVEGEQTPKSKQRKRHRSHPR